MAKIVRKRWTPADDARLRAMWGDGLSDAQLSVAFDGRTIGAIRHHAHHGLKLDSRGGGPRRNWSERDDLVLAAYWPHDEANTIAKHLGRTLSAIVQRAAELDLGPKSTKKVTFAELSRKSGYDRTTLMNAARRLKTSLHRAKVPQPRIKNPRNSHDLRNRHYALSPDMVKRILDSLDPARGLQVKMKWGGKTYKGEPVSTACIGSSRGPCDRPDAPPKTRERCARCYSRHVNNNDAHRAKKRELARQYRARRRHDDAHAHRPNQEDLAAE